MVKKKIKQIKSFLLRLIRKDSFWVICFGLVFSSIIMFGTFGYKDESIQIGDKLWSDFLSHIPLIRSFSLGDNIPPEYPIFSGEPIKYHFLFYMLVGFLEKTGIRIDVALNILSVIGLTGLLFAIYKLALHLFKKKAIGWMSMFVVIFNPSLSWIYYFFVEKFAIKSPWDLVTNRTFAGFGPYNDNIVQAFWNLNIFTNQRHLAFAFMLLFLIVYLIVYRKSKKSLIIGILLIGIMAWLHKAILLLLFISLGFYFITYGFNHKRILIGLLVGILVALPGLIYLNNANFSYELAYGYSYNSTSWWELPDVKSPDLKWLIFWVMNLGLLIPFAIAGCMRFVKKTDKTNKLLDMYKGILNEKTIWFFIGLASFFIGNAIQFAPDLNTNHKFFNFTIFVWGMYAAYFIFRIIKKSVWVGVIIFIMMILGGLIDFFPAINMGFISIKDYKNDITLNWIVNNTEPDSRILNITGNSSIFTTAGRRIYFGGEYFNWSIGYDVEDHARKIIQIIKDVNKDNICTIMEYENVDYISMQTGTSYFRDVYKVDSLDFEDEFDYTEIIPNSNILLISKEKNCT